MPAQRLPWFRFWVGATAHGKVRGLDDGTFRTWVELLDASSQQPQRGRFSSRREAASITRRPARHIAALIDVLLVDEAPDGRLTMHDWDWWQRWRKEDANDYANNTGMATPSPHDRHVNVNGPLREKREERRENKRLKEKDVTPPAASQQAPPGEARRRVTVVDEQFTTSIETQFADAFGSREAVRDVINTAMSHTARLKCTDQQAYLRSWVRRDAQRLPTRARVEDAESTECECEQLLVDLAINRNCRRTCPVHGWLSDEAISGLRSA